MALETCIQSSPSVPASNDLDTPSVGVDEGKLAPRAAPKQSIGGMEDNLANSGGVLRVERTSYLGEGGEGRSSLGPFSVAAIHPAAAIAATAPFAVIAPVRSAAALLLDVAVLCTALLAQAAIHAAAAIGIPAAVGGIGTFGGGLCHDTET